MCDANAYLLAALAARGPPWRLNVAMVCQDTPPRLKKISSGRPGRLPSLAEAVSTPCLGNAKVAATAAPQGPIKLAMLDLVWGTAQRPSGL